MSELGSEQRRILYVDDDALALRAAKRAIIDPNIVIDTAISAEEALGILEEREYPVVMSDYQMPGMNGLRLLERLRHIWPDTVCVLVTAHATLEAAIRAINRVALYRFITKPWNDDELRAMLRSACEQYDLSRENRRLAGLLEQSNIELRKANERLDRKVHRRTTLMLVGLLNALDHRDTETQGHSLRVGLYARRLVQEFELDDKQSLDIERGALLHDIGKIGVSDTILLKPGKLTVAEWAEMRKHAVYGHNILRSIDFLLGAAEVVRSHHERFDGGGYPDGLVGDAIPIGARIFAVIDTYDAMTSDRPYRKALDPMVARAELGEHRGAQFDPLCVDAFMKVPQGDLDEIKSRVERVEGRDSGPLAELLHDRGLLLRTTAPPRKG